MYISLEIFPRIEYRSYKFESDKVIVMLIDKSQALTDMYETEPALNVYVFQVEV